MEPRPTTRAVIDPLKKCQVRCKMCYYIHKELESVRPAEHLFNDLNGVKGRKNNYFDITGGEPMLHPEIVPIINHGHGLGLKCCMISNALTSGKRLDGVLDTGIDDFLISIHGTEEIHDGIVQVPGARKKQELFMAQVREKFRFRVNFVITSFNQNDIVATANYLTKWQPTMVNFINFNPHHEWRTHEDAPKMMADLFVVEHQLTEAIKILEANGTAVNVRYYPMCRLPEEYRRCVCNDLHVGFDPYEWDYGVMPKTVQRYTQFCRRLSLDTEQHEHPCDQCDLEWICGGINKYFQDKSGGRFTSKVTDATIENKNDFYHYRRHAGYCLVPR